VTPSRTSAAALAIAAASFLLAANLPYAGLIESFGYDDVLREPTGVILERFRAGGGRLVALWFAFAMGALAFIPVAALLSSRSRHPRLAMVAFALGLASALCQAAGLMRWVLVVPSLADLYVDPLGGDAQRAAATVMFDAVHRYGGTVVGEFLGQSLLAAWTALVAWQLRSDRRIPAMLAGAGFALVPLWLLAQFEILAAVMPGLPRVEAAPIAFMAWEAWILAIAGWIVAQEWRAGRSLAQAAVAGA
jgi:Domain of unknown function (DUF4386)